MGEWGKAGGARREEGRKGGSTQAIHTSQTPSPAVLATFLLSHLDGFGREIVNAPTVARGRALEGRESKVDEHYVASDIQHHVLELTVATQGETGAGTRGAPECPKMRTQAPTVDHAFPRRPQLESLCAHPECSSAKSTKTGGYLDVAVHDAVGVDVLKAADDLCQKCRNHRLGVPAQPGSDARG